MADNYFFSPASSFIVGANYSPATKVLQVKFKNGDTFNYGDVDEGVWTGFQAAPSKGVYFHGLIKDNYPNEQV